MRRSLICVPLGEKKGGVPTNQVTIVRIRPLTGSHLFSKISAWQKGLGMFVTRQLQQRAS